MIAKYSGYKVLTTAWLEILMGNKFPKLVAFDDFNLTE